MKIKKDRLTERLTIVINLWKIEQTTKTLAVLIHFTAAICGGFFGAYAILTRVGNFGQAQTANLIEMAEALFAGDGLVALIRLGAALIFIFSIAAATIMDIKSSKDVRYIAICFDILAAISMGFIPETVNPVLALYPVFFAMAFQWCIFKDVSGYASATIFCSNNLKQTITSVTESLLLPHDSLERKEKQRKAKYFGGTFLSFYIGVTAECAVWQILGVYSIWCNICFMLLLAYLVKKDNQLTNQVKRTTAIRQSHPISG